MERTRIALDKIFEDKVHVPAALTACFAPTVCSNYEVGEGQPGLSKSGSNNSRHEALLKMEIDVKKNVSAVIQENVSLMTEGDEALLSALRERTATNYDDDDDESVSDSTNLNTIGEATLHDNENRSSNDISCKKSLPKIPGAYKQSIKSKFDHYRKHKQFNGGALQPINGNSENEGTISFTSEKHDDDLISLATSQATDATSDDQQKSSTRRNELAKQILKRRQSQPMTPSRTAIDP